MPRLKPITDYVVVGFLLTVIVVGGLIRLWSLGSSVPILNRDEAALAYNAFLLTESGKDEWGVSWPITLQSFGDYKLIGYPALLTVLFHMTVPTDTLVRLPSALAGILLIVVSFFFGRRFGLRSYWAVFFTFCIAVGPVFIFFSRFAYEANVALLYTVNGILLLLIPTDSLVKRIIIDFTANILFFAASFTYNSPLLLFPIIVGVILLSRIRKGWRFWLPLVFISISVYSLILWQILPVVQQKSSISIFSDENIRLAYINYRENLPKLIRYFIGNKYFYYVYTIIQNICQSFSPQFLLLRPFHEWHGLPHWGQVFSSIAILGWLGCFWLIYKGIISFKNILVNSKNIYYIFENRSFQLLIFLFISLVPAAITIDAPHATRSLLFFYLFTLVAVCFLQYSNDYFFKKFVNLKQFLVVSFGVLIILYFYSITLYCNHLFFSYPRLANKIYRAGFPQAVFAVDDKTNIAVVDPHGYQYILLAWYLKFSAQKYFDTNIRQQPDQIGFRYGEKVGKYHFIVDKKDRSASESALLQWDTVSNTWHIQQ